jgi:hypothetical protein
VEKLQAKSETTRELAAIDDTAAMDDTCSGATESP